MMDGLLCWVGLGWVRRALLLWGWLPETCVVCGVCKRCAIADEMEDGGRCGYRPAVEDIYIIGLDHRSRATPIRRKHSLVCAAAL